ncbi:hypothetical protein BV898_04997 [Hypsibius exemplaris]|uniref:LysM domain-containing protein n=1 Tax=Hypsibius exemplaris TaxID=2072580 RepID=A0A1W0X0V3_HYPEX|nr:hypothetical protein BV898_04997 [Hypsibius exemplaris]
MSKSFVYILAISLVCYVNAAPATVPASATTAAPLQRPAVPTLSLVDVPAGCNGFWSADKNSFGEKACKDSLWVCGGITEQKLYELNPFLNGGKNCATIQRGQRICCKNPTVTAPTATTAPTEATIPEVCEEELSKATLDFKPNPGIFYRCSHCPPEGYSGLEQPTPLSIAQLLLTGVPYSAGNQPTVSLADSNVPNLAVTILALQYPIVPSATTGEATPCPAVGGTPSTCVYAVDFSLSQLPHVGFLNKTVVVNVKQADNKVLGSISVNLNFNCNPIWQAISANIGPTPVLVNFETATLANKGITFVKVPSLTASPIVSASSASKLASYAVHYNTPNGIGEPTSAVKPTGAAVGPKKVYVNCNQGSIAGNTVIAVVQATDPANQPVSYFAYSSVTEKGTVGAGREQHTITSAGVLSISGTAGTVGVSNQATPDGSVGGDANGGAIGTLLAPAATPDVPKDVFLVALSNAGCSSVLQARFYLACGEIV